MSEGRRISIVAIDEKLIEDILRLPSGVRCHGVCGDWDRRAILVRLEPTPESPYRRAFPVVREGEIIPIRHIECDGVHTFTVSFRWWFVLATVSRWEKIKSAVRNWRKK